MSPENIIAAILERRGIALDQQALFLHPDFDRDQHDGSQMRGMQEAILRVQQAIQNKEKIVIFGDYDADGVPGTALLTRGLQALGIDPLPLIPLRTEGYGLTATAVARIKKEQPTVLITVDNGTVAVPEISELQKSGIDVIVIDHHEPHGTSVAGIAHALINPKQADCPYPFKELCACGLVWKFLFQLYQASGRKTDSLKWELDLVALSTVADMVPLIDENRLFALYGLKVLAKTRNVGLRELSKLAGIALDSGKPPTAGDIGFRLAPRINAPSRMHQEVVDGQYASLRLLITNDTAEAARLAEHLNRQNTERQELVDRHVKEAREQVAQLLHDTCLVVYNPTWSSGVIGLVASKLMDEYNRPVIALAPEMNDDGSSSIKGSVRSCGDVEALTLLDAASELLERYGGHAKAAGLTLISRKGLLPEQLVSDFRQAILSYLEKSGISLETIEKGIAKDPDHHITLAEANLDLAKCLDALGPFGLGFPTPLFRTEAKVTKCRMVGKDGVHLSCYLENEGIQRKAIAFGWRNDQPNHPANCTIDFTVSQETWQGVTSAVCMVKRIESPAA